VEVMTNLSTAEIEMIEYVDGIRASQRWGLGHENGVINVISRNR
jgi:outer membrane cobalamin receptor